MSRAIVLAVLLSACGAAATTPLGSRAPSAEVRVGRRVEGVPSVVGGGLIVDPSGYCVTLAHFSTYLEPYSRHAVGSFEDDLMVEVEGRWVDARVVRADAQLDLAVLKLAGEGPWPSAEVRRDPVALLEPLSFFVEHFHAPMRLSGQVVSMRRDASGAPTAIFLDEGAPRPGFPLYDANGRPVALSMDSALQPEIGLQHAVAWARPLSRVPIDWLSPVREPRVIGVFDLREGEQVIEPRREGPMDEETLWFRIPRDTAGWVAIEPADELGVAVVGPNGDSLRAASDGRIALLPDDEPPSALRVRIASRTARARLTFHRAQPPEELIPHGSARVVFGMNAPVHYAVGERDGDDAALAAIVQHGISSGSIAYSASLVIAAGTTEPNVEVEVPNLVIGRRYRLLLRSADRYEMHELRVRWDGERFEYR